MIWIGKQIGILTARATHHRVSGGTESTDVGIGASFNRVCSKHATNAYVALCP
jgi:hypothetical protein